MRSERFNFPNAKGEQLAATLDLPLGKPTVIFSSDDVASKGQMQLELTATPVR